MNSTEFNKIAGAGLGALLIFLLVNFFSGQIYGTGEGGHGEEHVLAFALPVEGAGEAPEEEPQVDLLALVSAADPAAGESTFRACTACHAVEDGANKVGPHLFDVVGRDIASVEGFGYSDALMAAEGDWTLEHMSAFLENPKAWAPGTKMSYAGLKDPQDRVNVIAYLNQIGGTPVDLAEGLEPLAEATAIGESGTAIPDPALSPGVGPGPGVTPPGEAMEGAPAPAESAAVESMSEAAEVEGTAQAVKPEGAEGVGAATAPGAAEGSVSEGETAGGQVTGVTVVEPTAEGTDAPTSPAVEAQDEDAEGEQPRGEDILQTGDPTLDAPTQENPGLAGLPGEATEPREGQPDAGTPEQAAAIPGPVPPSQRVAGEDAPPQTPPSEAPASGPGGPAGSVPATEAYSERAGVPDTPPAEPTDQMAAAPAETGAGAAPATGGIDFASADVAAGEKLFRRCAACHKIEEGKNGIGPSLWGVVGRPVAAVEGFNYSDAMAAHGGEWTPEHLSAYLENPKAVVPGTKMAFAGLKDLQDRIDVIAYLNQHAADPQPLQ